MDVCASVCVLRSVCWPRILESRCSGHGYGAVWRRQAGGCEVTHQIVMWALWWVVCVCKWGVPFCSNNHVDLLRLATLRARVCGSMLCVSVFVCEWVFARTCVCVCTHLQHVCRAAFNVSIYISTPWAEQQSCTLAHSPPHAHTHNHTHTITHTHTCRTTTDL